VLFCVNEITVHINNIITKILFNDKAYPSVPTPNPIYLGKNGIKKTKRKYTYLSLYEIMKKYALTANVKTDPNTYPLKAMYLFSQ
jgi:hypothetical protein